LDIRLPPGVPPAAVARAVRHRLRWSVPAAVRVHTEVIAAHHGDRFVPNAGLRRAVEFATTAGFGTPPAYVRSGGSIPAVGVLRRAFGIAPVLLGLGTPGGGAHGPDEHIDISGWFRSIDTGVALLGALGGLD
jgi:succinyl-diaminopimelate desuccinylase